MTGRGHQMPAGGGTIAERSDCLVTVERKARGGITIDLASKVGRLYGESIRHQVHEACVTLKIKHAAFHIADGGALPYVMAARLEAGIRLAFPEARDEFLSTIIMPSPGGRHPRERRRWSRLYLPGNVPRFITNAGLHSPDAVVLDLEDSVPPEEKVAARLIVRNALRSVDFHQSERMVRINAGHVGLIDLRVVVPQRPDVIVVPKVEDPDTVMNLATELGSLEEQSGVSPPIFLLPIIESALGVERAFEIASSSVRVCAIAIGLEDYARAIGVERTKEGKESLFARTAVVNAAKAAGVQALDSVFSDVDDLDGLRMTSVESKSLGFDGRGCIHPRQIGVVHAAFAPAAKEREEAEAIVLAARNAKKHQSGVMRIGSSMIDAPVVARAERILRSAEQERTGRTDQ